MAVTLGETSTTEATLARGTFTDPRHRGLQGQRVGYVRATTLAHYLAKAAGRGRACASATSRAVSLAPADGACRPCARGDLEAWAIYGYNGQLARIQYGARTIKNGVGYLSGNFPIYANRARSTTALRRAAIARPVFAAAARAFARISGNFLAYARESAETGCRWATLVELFNGRSGDCSLGPVSDAVVRSHQDVADTFLRSACSTARPTCEPLWDRGFDGVLRQPPAA